MACPIGIRFGWYGVLYHIKTGYRTWIGLGAVYEELRQFAKALTESI